MKKLRYYDFFSGAGLVRLGLQRDWDCVWANDIDPKKAETYRRNFGGERFFLGDIQDVQARTLPSPVDMAWASFPCQDLSLAGLRAGMAGERSGACWSFFRLLQELPQEKRPRLLVLENVVGLLYDPDLLGFFEALASLRMQFGILLIDGIHFVPQSRPRLFVVALDASVPCEPFLETWHFGSPWLSGQIEAVQTNLPSDLKDLWRWWKLPPRKEKGIEIESIIDLSKAAWESKEKTERLLAMMDKKNLEKVKDAQKSKEAKVGFLYKRTRKGSVQAEVRFDGVAGCLRTPSGGSSRQTVLCVEGETVRSRLISVREAARLMGTPDGFLLPENYNDGYHAIGDGVVVPLVEWLSEHLLAPLAFSTPKPLQLQIAENVYESRIGS